MTVTSYDPRTGETVARREETSVEELGSAVRAAESATPILAGTSPAGRRAWLYAVADALEEHKDELAQLAQRETALGLERLVGEVTRAAGQLRFYGDVAAEGSYLQATIDHGTETSPAIAKVNRPLGPVAVFGASNFPFAFSVLGNDTGAALAAGCPVVAKAHPAHVGLSMRQAEIAGEALKASGAPEGTFAVVNGHEAGADLVRRPEITAVAFTGSQAGGIALWRIANERDIVIPVYAEMGTVNPVIVTRDAAEEMDQIAAGFVGSFTLGNGQFCTKPGLLLAPKGSCAPEAVGRALATAAPAPLMLTETIAKAVRTGISELEAAGAALVHCVEQAGGGWAAPAAVLRAEATDLKPGSRLLEECFGAVVIVSEYESDDQLQDVLATLQGSLAASVFTGDEADPQAPGLIRSLTGKVGRIAVNTWPTGVSYTWAQQHGGPWPATSVPAATSVGAHGLARFVRPVAFQSTHDKWLPAEVQGANPWRIPRRVNGRLQLPSEDLS